MSVVSSEPCSTSRPRVHRSLWNRLARTQVRKTLNQLKHGQITIVEGNDRKVLGDSSQDGLDATIQVQDPKIYSRMASGGSLGAAESYLRGEWQCDDLVALFRILCRNMEHLLELESGLSKLAGKLSRFVQASTENTKKGSQKNIAAHYDLSNEFFELFLDPTLMYSSGYFAEESISMAEASLAKLDLICRKLDLKPTDHVIEIGTGWGGFAEFAVENYGCRVTTTTISSQQHEYARQRFARQPQSERITLLKDDYRDLEGQYDKLVSIEMIEAVGADYLSTYFQKCESLLKPGGQMLIQGILMPDNRYPRYRKSVDFIQKYIFPGGHLPSVSAIQQSLAGDTRLRLIGFEEFAKSYALTLRAWRKAFVSQLDQVRHLGFDDRFIRMWEYYLCYCEGAFLEEATSVGQFVWRKTAY